MTKKGNTKTILVVEDDPVSLLLYDNYLALKGLMVLTAANGKDAIELFNLNPEIAIILMDIRLPDVDGINTMKEIRKISKDVIIIAQTAYAMVDEKAKLLKAGFDNYLSKPVRPDTLYEMLLLYL
jgi:two-component system, cell cycle response regulator DivK